MKKIIYFLIILIANSSLAQTPDDALRLMWNTGNGTARNMGAGGVMGSVGGDISAIGGNPAGLGLFSTNEAVITPAIGSISNNFDYRGTESSNSKTIGNYGASGVIFAKPYNNESGKGLLSGALGLSINRVASFDNHIQFTGFNNVSSFSEEYLEELTRDGADTNAALSNYIFGSSLAFRTYLIDTIAAANGYGYKSLVPISTGVIQSYDETTSGGINEISIAYATNLNNRWFFGGTLAIPIVNYSRSLTYSETDASNNPNDNFQQFTYNEQFSSSGAGAGLKLGAIYQPIECLRFGLALHTPQVIGVRDVIRSNMATNTKAYSNYKTIYESSDNLNDGNAGTRDYSVITPWHFMGSGTLLINNRSNKRKPKGYLSGDVEYVGYGGASFDNSSSDDALANYINTANDAIKSYYSGAFNFRFGGEVKFYNGLLVRCGTAYYGSPYADNSLKAGKTLITGGLGYRGRGYFVDVAYVETTVKDVVFPYRLTDKANTYSLQKSNVGSLLVTVGVKW